jgi:hypothetical protein
VNNNNVNSNFENRINNSPTASARLAHDINQNSQHRQQL